VRPRTRSTDRRERWALVAVVLAAVTLSFGPARAQAEPAPAPIIVPGMNEEEWAKRPAGGKVGHAGMEAAGFAGRGYGIRPFVGDGTAGPGQSTVGVALRERGTGLLMARWISARYLDEIWLGYDGVDFAARALLDASIGLRLPLLRSGGPVARVALLAEATQLTGWSKTELRLGAGEFGWTYARGPAHLDLVFQIGPTLLGQVDLGATHRNLAGLTWGAYLTSGWEDLLLDFRMSQIAADSAGPVTDLRAEVCGLLGGGKPRPTKTTRGRSAAVFAGLHGRDYRATLCADVSYGRASDGAASDPSRYSTVGISILIGRSSRLDPLARPGL
jgi:hypothetical protein